MEILVESDSVYSFFVMSNLRTQSLQGRTNKRRRSQISIDVLMKHVHKNDTGGQHANHAIS